MIQGVSIKKEGNKMNKALFISTLKSKYKLILICSSSGKCNAFANNTDNSATLAEWLQVYSLFKSNATLNALTISKVSFSDSLLNKSPPHLIAFSKVNF